MEVKICSQCKTDKPISNYTVNNSAKDGLNASCKACKKVANGKRKQASLEQKAKWAAAKREARKKNPELVRKKAREWAKKNPDSARNTDYKKRFGITLDDYNRMFKEQGGVCAICGEGEKCQRFGHLSVDHCHGKGHVRGLLCNNCNNGLGRFKDNIDRLEQAINYLKEKG